MVKTFLGIFTAGGLARAIASHFEYNHRIVEFVDTPRGDGECIRNIPIIQKPSRDIKYVIGCGDPKRRQVLSEEDVLWSLPLIHKSTNVSEYASIWEGTIICPGVGIDPDVLIGEHVYVDYNSVIGHNAKIGGCTVIGPLVLVAGYCEIGKACYVGAGAKIVRNAKIGDGAVIGAGAVVLGDVPPNEVWAGVPAKKIGVV